MEDPDYERKLTRLRNASAPQPLQGGVLFVDGFSVCGVDFHLHHLLKLPWPACSKYLYSWKRDKAAELAQILEQNTFKMIVLPGLCGDWKYQFAKAYARNRPALERLQASIKSAVEDKGATLVLFSTEKSSFMYKDLFGKPWEECCYVRTSCFKTPAASAVLPAAAPHEANAKAIHLKNVPEAEAWYMTTSQSANNSLLPRPELGPGLVSIAAGAAGSGRIVYVGDVNADRETCQAIQQLAYALFPNGAQQAAPVGGGVGAAAGAAAAGAAAGAAGGGAGGAAAAAGGGGEHGGNQRVCATCGVTSDAVQVKRCSRCQQVYYCSRDCQRTHWPQHRGTCVPA